MDLEIDPARAVLAPNVLVRSFVPEYKQEVKTGECKAASRTAARVIDWTGI